MTRIGRRFVPSSTITRRLQAQDDRVAAELALGRILRLGSRPAQAGDIDDYERCRRVLLNTLDQTATPSIDHAPSYARDRQRGAAGD